MWQKCCFLFKTPRIFCFFAYFPIFLLCLKYFAVLCVFIYIAALRQQCKIRVKDKGNMKMRRVTLFVIPQR